MRDSGVENTQDAQDVKADFRPKPHSRNTIVGLSLLVLSPIFKGHDCSKKYDRMARHDIKKRAFSEQFTSSIEKFYRNLPICLGDSAFVVGS